MAGWTAAQHVYREHVLESCHSVCETIKNAGEFFLNLKPLQRTRDSRRGEDGGTGTGTVTGAPVGAVGGQIGEGQEE